MHFIVTKVFRVMLLLHSFSTLGLGVELLRSKQLQQVCVPTVITSSCCVVFMQERPYVDKGLSDVVVTCMWA